MKRLLSPLTFFSKACGTFGSRRHAIILAYHRVCPHAECVWLLKDMAVQPDDFDRQLGYLKRNFDVVPLSQLPDILSNGSRLKVRPVALTFDDGYKDNFQYAFPILKKHNAAATFFIPTGFVEDNHLFWWERLASAIASTSLKKAEVRIWSDSLNLKLDGTHQRATTFKKIAAILKYKKLTLINDFLENLSTLLKVTYPRFPSYTMTWNQIAELCTSGIVRIGAHSHTHQPLTILEDGELAEELNISRQMFLDKLGITVDCFAYPYGEVSDFNQNIKNYVHKNGYRCALTMRQGFCYPGDDVFNLNRIGIGGFDTDEIFKTKIYGILPFINNLRSIRWKRLLSEHRMNLEN